MTPRLIASALLSRVNGFLFGTNVDENEIATETLRDLMAIESAVSDETILSVQGPRKITNLMKERGVSQKRVEIAKLSDENIVLLNKLLPSFSSPERTRIINDVSSHGLTDYQTSRYLRLLDSVTYLGDTSGVFADPTFFNLVKGLDHAIKRTADSDLLGKSELGMKWSDTTDLSMEKLRVRFGLKLHIIAKTTYSEPLAHLFRDRVKDIGLVLRDRSLESLLLRHPERMEDIYDLLLSNYTMTGNKIGSILNREYALIGSVRDDLDELTSVS